MAYLTAVRQARSHKHMFYVYVLRSLKTGEFYKGLTSDLDQRLKDHESGKTRSTKYRLPFELVYVEICSDRKDARIREKYLKSGIGRELIREILRLRVNKV